MSYSKSKDKGTRAENLIKGILKKHTGLNFQRTPQSGALNKVHSLKGDLYVPNEKNLYCIEVKHYKEDNLTSKILTSVSPTIIEWWDQTVRESEEVGKKPLLIFKFDRSKNFVGYYDLPCDSLPHIYINVNGRLFFCSILEAWLTIEKPKFIQ